MYKIIFIGLVVVFFSSGALVYSNGNLSLNIENAKKSLVDVYDSLAEAIEG